LNAQFTIVPLSEGTTAARIGSVPHPALKNKTASAPRGFAPFSLLLRCYGPGGQKTPCFCRSNSLIARKISLFRRVGKLVQQSIDFVGVGLADAALLPSNFSIPLFRVCVSQGSHSLLVSGC
jgi:hypothetical protein